MPGPADRARFALAGKLFGSTAAAQGAALVATTAAALRAGPLDFSRYASIVAISGVINSVNSLAVETRIPVVRETGLAILKRVGVSFTVLVAVLTGGTALGGALVGAGWTASVVCITLACLATSAATLGSALVIRRDQPTLLARNRLVQGFGNAVLVVGFILTPMPPYLVLAGAWIASTAAGAVVMLRGVRRDLPDFRIARRGDLRTALHEVRTQPLNNLAAVLGTSLPPMLLPAMGAPVVAGAWALVSRILNAVVNTVYQTVYPMYSSAFSAAVRSRDTNSMLALNTRWLKRLLMLAIPMVLGTVIGIEWILPLLGSKWLPVRHVLLPACLSFPAIMVWLPLSQTLVLVGRMNLELVWTLGNLVASAVPLLMIPVVGGLAGLTTWAAVQAASLLVHTLMQRHGIRQRRIPGSDPSTAPPL